MSGANINLDNAPEWDVSITIRGVEMHLVSPNELPDMPEAPLPTQKMIDARLNRRPGLIGRLRLIIFGDPHDSMPQDGGAAYLRQVVGLEVGEHHAEFLETLTTGEHAQIHASYLRSQNLWLDAVGAFAAQQASAAFPALSRRLTNTPTTRSAPVGEPLIPGGPLPIALDPRHNPLVKDNRKNTGGASA